MCGVVCILLYYALYQSSLWLPGFNKLLVLSVWTLAYNAAYMKNLGQAVQMIVMS